MDKTAMVGVDIVCGTKILDALDRAKVKASVALLAYLSDYEDWRLILAGRQFDTPDLGDAFQLLNDATDAVGLSPRLMPPVLIFPTTDRFIRDLRRLFSKTKSVEGMRLGGQTFGDRFVEDAYVYRIS